MKLIVGVLREVEWLVGLEVHQDGIRQHITIFVHLGFVWHFDIVANIRTWIKSQNIGECCKMQIL